MADAGGLEGRSQGPAFVSGAVVSHDPLDRDAVAGELGSGADQEGDGALLALVRQELDVGEPAGVIDGHVERLPSGPSLAALTTPGRR